MRWGMLFECGGEAEEVVDLFGGFPDGLCHRNQERVVTPEFQRTVPCVLGVLIGGGNSGFYFHVGDRKSPVAQGIEVQLYDSGSKPADAKLTDHDSGGVIPGVPPQKNTAKPAGEWNSMKVTVQDKTLTVHLNGEQVNQVDLDKGGLKSRPATGSIGFQDHGLPIKLRRFRITPN